MEDEERKVEKEEIQEKDLPFEIKEASEYHKPPPEEDNPPPPTPDPDQSEED